jgi:hypothetical protein
MRTNRIATILIGVGATLGVVPGAAAGDYMVVSANICLPESSHWAEFAGFDQYGVYADGNTNVTQLWCAMPNTATVNVDPTSFSATVYDRSPTEAVRCDLFRLNHNGDLSWSQTRTTDGPGWSWPATTFNWSVPSNGGYGYVYAFHCFLPRYHGLGGGYSWLTSFSSTRP